MIVDHPRQNGDAAVVGKIEVRLRYPWLGITSDVRRLIDRDRRLEHRDRRLERGVTAIARCSHRGAFLVGA